MHCCIVKKITIENCSADWIFVLVCQCNIPKVSTVLCFHNLLDQLVGVLAAGIISLCNLWYDWPKNYPILWLIDMKIRLLEP